MYASSDDRVIAKVRSTCGDLLHQGAYLKEIATPLAGLAMTQRYDNS